MKFYYGKHEKNDKNNNEDNKENIENDIAYNAGHSDPKDNDFNLTSIYNVISEKPSGMHDVTSDTIKVELPVVDKRKMYGKRPRKKKKLTRKDIMNRILKISGIAAIFMVVLVIVGFATFSFMAYSYTDSDIDEAFNNLRLDYTTVIYAKDTKGNYKELERLYMRENRIWVDYDKIPQYMKDAVVAIEDKRFMDHSGVDWRRFIKACVNYFVPIFDDAGGGSTITQQLIKNLTLDKEKTAFRKYREVMRSLYVERRYDKPQLLEYYLNDVYFGKSCYGVQSAANYYFGKDISELTLAECASIAAITNRPAKYDPFISLENNQKRQKLILNAMLSQEKITQEEYDEAIEQELKLAEKGKSKVSRQSYFVDALIEEIVRDLRQEYGYEKAEAEKLVFTQGLKIYATVDTQIQDIMDDVYSKTDNFPKGKNKEENPQSAMIVLDPKTSAILGIVGGIGEKTVDRGLNRATQSKRQPGSSIKPIAVYAPAIEANVINLSTIYVDKAVSFGSGKNAYKPRNAYRGYLGKITMKKAVEKSTNTVAVQILNDLGVDRAFNFLVDKLNMTTLVDKRVTGKKTFTDKSLSLALGGVTDGVTVEEITAAYSIFTNKGIYTEPHTYTLIEKEDGTPLIEKRKKSNIAVSDETAFLTRTLIHAAVESGTATTAKLGYLPVAGKTGTTSDDKDRWFIGFTPYYLGGAWFGYDQPKPLDDNGIRGNPAAKAWKLVMDKIHKKKKLTSGSFPAPPSTIMQAQFCLETGLKPGPNCKVATENFVIGTEPVQVCTVHGTEPISTPASSCISSSLPSQSLGAASGSSSGGSSAISSKSASSSLSTSDENRDEIDD